MNRPSPFLPALTAVLSAACSGIPAGSGEATCDDREKICYSGHVIDRGATQRRYGVHGMESINEKTGRDP